MLVDWHLLIKAEHRKTSCEILGLPLLWNKGTLKLKVSGSCLANPALLTSSVCHDGFISTEHCAAELLLPCLTTPWGGSAARRGFSLWKQIVSLGLGQIWAWIACIILSECTRCGSCPQTAIPPHSWKSSWTPEGEPQLSGDVYIEVIWNRCWFNLTDLGITEP